MSDTQEVDLLADVFAKIGKAMIEHKEKYVFGEDIKYPIEITGITFGKSVGMWRNGVGSLVAIRPVGEEYGGKTYLGLYVGDFPIDYPYELEKETSILHVHPHLNPAIFVFDLNKLIYGCESWWTIIENEDQLKQITDADIQNVWYIKALNQIHGEPTGKSDPAES